MTSPKDEGRSTLRSSNVRKCQGPIFIGNFDDLIEPREGVAHVLCIGQRFFPMFWKCEYGVGQIALLR